MRAVRTDDESRALQFRFFGTADVTLPEWTYPQWGAALAGGIGAMVLTWQLLAVWPIAALVAAVAAFLGGAVMSALLMGRVSDIEEPLGYRLRVLVEELRTPHPQEPERVSVALHRRALRAPQTVHLTGDRP